MASLFFLTLVFLAPFLHASSCPSSLNFAVGVYTYQPWLPNSAGAGVTIATLTIRGLSATTIIWNSTTGENPSYCAQGRRGALYCVNENQAGSLTRLSAGEPATHAGTDAGGSTHLAVLCRGTRDGGERVIAANYGGAVSAFVYTRSGLSLKQKITIPQKFASKSTGQQDGPHPHMVLPLNDGDVLVPDLGSDRIWRFGVDSSGSLHVKKNGLAMQKGDGPRHAVLGKGDNVYVVNEISNTVARVRGCSGSTMRECERKPLIDGRTKTVSGNAAAAIRISRDYRFLYTSVRAKDGVHGTIAVFKLGSDGQIGDRVGLFSTHGEHPRDFSIIENGPDCKSYVAVANQNSNNIVLMERDRTTGAISKSAKFTLLVKTPTCVLPVRGLRL